MATASTAIDGARAAPAAAAPDAAAPGKAGHAVGALLDRAAIAARVPHQGAMCLLDRLAEWDADHAVCHADNHGDPQHPLRTPGGLLAACAIEYAAQAMALHGSLLGDGIAVSASASPQPPTAPVRPGFLASVRDVQLHRARLDDLADPLRIEAVRLAGDARQILYRFTVSSGGCRVADGRATVVLDTPLAGAGHPPDTTP